MLRRKNVFVFASIRLIMQRLNVNCCEIVGVFIRCNSSSGINSEASMIYEPV
jgi:hypothetical protein